MGHITPDRDWFERLFREHYGRVHAYAVRRVGSNAADDVVAEVFSVAWNRGPDVPDAPLPWLYGVARNVVLHEHRDRGRRDALVARAGRDLLRAQPGTPTSAVEAALIVQRVLATLPETDAEVLRLTVWEELTPTEIAGVLGCSAGAVRVRLHRARRRAQEVYQATAEPDAAASDITSGQPTQLTIVPQEAS